MIGSAMLDERGVRPGTMAAGHVHLWAGRSDHAVAAVTVTLTTVVSGVEIDFLRCQVAAGFAVPAGRSRAIPFEQPLPWETPVTHVAGEHLPAVSVRLRTTVTVDGAGPQDVGVTPAIVHPTAGQRRVLAELRRLGWTFPHCEVRQGSVPGVRQSDPFLQWFDCAAPELTGPARLAFVANPVGVDVLLEAAGGQHRFAVRHGDADDVAELLERRLLPARR